MVQEWQFLTSGIGLLHLSRSYQETAPQHARPGQNPACTGHHPTWLLVLQIAITILVSAFGFVLLEDSRCHQIDVLICVPCDKECGNVWLRVGTLRIDLLSSLLLGTTRDSYAGPRSIAAMLLRDLFVNCYEYRLMRMSGRDPNTFLVVTGRQIADAIPRCTNLLFAWQFVCWFE